MALTTTLKHAVNGVLEPFNLQLETLTARRRETGRLRQLAEARYFDRPAFPIPPSIAACEPDAIVRSVQAFRDRFDTFEHEQTNDVGFTFDNAYFSSPDAEVLYAMVRTTAPKTIVEIGCGNSTKISRQAIRDGGLSTRLIAVDPSPRTEIEAHVDELFQYPVEKLGDDGPFGRLESGDILFIDSSHEIRPGNDCVFLYLRVLPQLPAGVVVHIHDMFLPFEYPDSWIFNENRAWNEQYLVQAMLMAGPSFEVLWPGYYLQQTRAEFGDWFPHARNRRAQSLWLRKRG